MTANKDNPLPTPAATIQERRSADWNHDVLTVESRRTLARYTPCDTCPWLPKNNGEFPAEAFRLSAHTCTSPERLVTQSGVLAAERAMRTFACHTSGTEKPTICAGFIAAADEAVSWRVGVITGKFDPGEVDTALYDFHSNYFEMAVANGVPEDDPSLDCCRPAEKRVPRERK